MVMLMLYKEIHSLGSVVYAVCVVDLYPELHALGQAGFTKEGWNRERWLKVAQDWALLRFMHRTVPVYPYFNDPIMMMTNSMEKY
jgi:hypothetical protein